MIFHIRVKQIFKSIAFRQFGFTYHAILSLAMQLFEKGYLNPIPKMEKGDSEGRAKDDDSTAGWTLTIVKKDLDGRS